jgi:phosphoribosylformylglycinamidine cyclo-ligase
VVEGRERQRCGQCRFVLFENPAGAAAGVVVDAEGRVLLVRRALEPHKGDWALPAGYQDIDEEPSAACAREVREETGLEVEVLELFDLLFVPGDVRKPANLAVYLCCPKGGELQAADDAEDARFFALDDLPENIGFDNSRRVLSKLVGSPAYERAVACAAPMSAKASAQAPTSLSYKDAGVNIDSADEALTRVKAAIRKSFTPGVLGDVGLFGGLFDLARVGAGTGVLVASADGVGTKLEVAKRARVYDTVGRDLVQHCINDILVQGARPLFFLDYVATGVLEPHVVSELIRGCAEACTENGLALLGGETAEMPGLYAPGDFDLAGVIVGVVEPDHLLDGSRVRPGQVLLGLRSAGLHTNGYSLARKILFEVAGLALDDRPDELGGATVAEALLAEHRSYYQLLWPLLEADRIAALAHITGGGLRDNLPRVLGECDAVIDRDAWSVPGLFRLLVEAGGVDPDEAQRAFNMGVGMVLLAEPDQEAPLRAHLEAAGEEVLSLGTVEAAQGAKGRVRWAR